jgi:acetyl-CoA synthetase
MSLWVCCDRQVTTGILRIQGHAGICRNAHFRGENRMSTIESVLHENRVFAPSAEFVKQANISGMPAYKALCDEAEQDYEGFWARQARDNLLWHKPFDKVLDQSNPPFFKWFYDGELNVSYNCLDRHLNTQPNKVALIFEADDGSVTKITYKQLYHRVCQFANGLKSLGIKPGDRVVIYMPMSIEAVAAMQAFAEMPISGGRIG